MPNDNWKEGPEIGMGATAGAGSDSYPYTIIDVSDETITFDAEVPNSSYYDVATGKRIAKREKVTWPKWILVTADDYKVVDDGKEHSYGDHREYAYTSHYDVSRAHKYILHPASSRYRAASTKYDPERRTYIETNTTTQKNRPISIGYRRYYQDPSF